MPEEPGVAREQGVSRDQSAHRSSAHLGNYTGKIRPGHRRGVHHRVFRRLLEAGIQQVETLEKSH